jgi:hypothetical protein
MKLIDYITILGDPKNNTFEERVEAAKNILKMSENEAFRGIVYDMTQDEEGRKVREKVLTNIVINTDGAPFFGGSISVAGDFIGRDSVRYISNDKETD